jgi:hypothetical protein
MEGRPAQPLNAFSGIARMTTIPSRSFTAIPDLGASHILVRESDIHILQNVQYSKPNEAPFAVLKAANNAELTAIVRGTLSLAGLQPTAYIFRQGDLATNLFGLAPFCDVECEAVNHIFVFMCVPFRLELSEHYSYP